MKTTVREFLGNKPDVWTVGPDETVYRALELLAERNVGGMPVVEDGKLVGMFTERDYARKVILKGKASREVRVRELMSTPVLYVRPEQTMDDCMALMTAKRVRHLPVQDEGRLVGIVTIGDVVKHVISTQEHHIEQLQNYIQGTP